ncbi:hypothetical protein J4447_01515 [Candidatus Pacearchaeota archaeon]|nr:hypothetical protein [Candidatus Pacearchaeota archaeon]
MNKKDAKALTFIQGIAARHNKRARLKALEYKVLAEQSLASRETAGDGHFYLACAFLQEHKFGNAEQELAEAFESPRRRIRNYDIYDFLREVYQEKGDYEKKAEAITKMIETGAREGLYCTGRENLGADTEILVDALVMAGKEDVARQVFSEYRDLIDAETAKRIAEELEVKDLD